MAFMVNVCPACYEIMYEVSGESGDGKTISCPNCGHTENWEWWEMQNIELYITIQGVHSLTKAGELRTERYEALKNRRQK